MDSLKLWPSAFAIPGKNATYDYIVVGGGTAGLTIASRLSPSASVAVIEAGGFYEIENGNLSVVPFNALAMPFLDQTTAWPKQPLVDWGLVSVPQSGAGNREIHYAQGKTLGGSSGINTMAYMRGTKGYYDRWATAVGDPDFEFENLLPYFQQSTTLTQPNFAKRDTPSATFEYDHLAFSTSNGGPLQVSWGNWVDPTTSWMAKGLQSIGMELSKIGINSGVMSGGSWTTSTIDPKRATRSSSETSYLREAIRSTNIQVYTHTQATKVVFEGSRAAGVEVSTQGLPYTLTANKEIILSAGVFHSPQLLMVSGVGPRAKLESLKIPVISDLQGVGQNLQDQIDFSVLTGVNTPSAGGTVFDPSKSAENIRQYLNDAAGPYSSAGGYVSFEKIPSDFRANFSSRTESLLHTSLAEDWPEVEYVGFGLPGAGSSPSVGAITVVLMAPFSRGNVTISSPSVADPPLIDLGWLTDPADGELAVAGLKRARQAMASNVLDPVKVGGEIAPGEDVTSDEDLLAFIRSTAMTIWHASSTCAMGRVGDADAVVDSKGRVFGVTGLRVVDASVFPFSPPGHPQGTVYGLAEKIADDILKGK